MRKITIEPNKYGHYEIFGEDIDGNPSYYVQTDWEFPSLASDLGFIPKNERVESCKEGCRSTDGTVTCRECGKTAGEYIGDASEFLDGVGEGEIPEESYNAYFQREANSNEQN